MSTLSDIWLPLSLSTPELVESRMRQAATPAGMRDRMYLELRRRMPLVTKLDDYFEGRHAFSFATQGFQQHAKMLAAVNDNWMPLCCTSRAQRMSLEGLKVTPDDRPAAGETSESDDEDHEIWAAWDLWRQSDLDEHSPRAWLDAVKLGEVYLLAEVVGTRPSGRPDVRITIEHPASMIIARDASDPSRATAALKAYTDEWGVEHATLWTPNTIYRWSRIGNREWALKSGELGEQKNPFAPHVQVVPITHDPQTLPARPPAVLLSETHGLRDYMSIGFGRSVMLDVIVDQDACNKLLRDLLFTAEYQAFRQRWVTGFRPEERDGKLVMPFRAGPGQVWTSPSELTKFGEFDQADLAPFLSAMEGRVASMSSRVSTPPHYFVGLTGTMPSGETLRATEAGLSTVCKAMQRPFGGGARRMMAIVLPVAHPELRGMRVDPDWADPEIRTQSEYMDSLVKKLALGVPMRQLWEDAGYTPEQINRFRAWIREQAAESWSVSLLSGQTPAMPGELNPPTADVGAGPSATPVPGAA